MLFMTAAERRGLVTHALAADFGIAPQTLRDRARREGWVKVTRGAWIVPGLALDDRGWGDVYVESFGERAALGHWSAAHVHDLAPRAPKKPEIVLPWDRHPGQNDDVRVFRSRTLVGSDVVVADDRRVTSVARTLRDLAQRVGERRLRDLVIDAEQRGLVTLPELAATADRLHHGPGSGRFRAVVESRHADRSDSTLEADTRSAVRAAGFDPSPGPFPVRAPDGQLLMLDIAFPHLWFAIECDGYAFHRDRRSFERDRERWRLAQQAGWTITWVTRTRLDGDLGGLIAEVQAAHHRGAAGRTPAVPAT